MSGSSRALWQYAAGYSGGNFGAKIMTNDDKCELLLDGNRGVYNDIPQNFCKEFKLELFGLSKDDVDVKTCIAGPDEEWYWDAWASIGDKAVVKRDGHEWRLFQDGDLWLVRDDMPENWFC